MTSPFKISIEPLSWDILVYWINKHPLDGPDCLMPTPIIVARRAATNEVVGFAALSTAHTMRLQAPVVAPLYADNLRIGMRIAEAMEAELQQVGEPFYLFFVNVDRHVGFVELIERVGICTRLWSTEAGDVWYRRDLPRNAPTEPATDRMEA